MILLKGQTLTQKDRFTPESMSVTLVDTGVSTASMTVGPSAPEIALGDWLKDDTEPGDGIVWRVKSVDTAFDTETRTFQMEHIFGTLRDGILFGSIEAKDIGGATKVTAKAAVQYVLKKQSIWTLGTFDYSKSLPYSFNNSTYLSAIESVCNTLEDSRYEFDLSSLPFKLSIVKKSTTVVSEMRASRNLQSIRRTVDTTNMYTRFYPVGAKNLHIDGNYVSKNEATYGVISRTETDQSKSNKEMLKEWALHRLRRHCEPNVTITIKGFELSSATGEPLDKLTLGRMCRVPLPEFNTTIKQYITRLTWADKIRAPEDVTVTLSNQRNDPQDVSSMLKSVSSHSSSNASGGAKAAEEDHAWIVDTTDKVGLVAEAVVGREESGAEFDWSRVSEIIVDGEGIHQRVTATQDELVVAESKIDMNESKITAEVTRATAAEGALSSRITVTAEAITAEVTRASEAEGTLSGRLTTTADAITAEVERATAAEGDLAASLQVTAEAVTSEVTRATEAEGQMSSAITQTAGKIEAEVQRATQEGAELSSRITQTAGMIEAEVKRASEAEGEMSSRITQTADSITAEVERAKSAEGDAVTQIQQTADKVSIIATDADIEAFKKKGGTGSMFSVTQDSITEAVGRITVVEGDITEIEGSALWRTKDDITGIVGLMEVTASGKLRVKSGTQFQINEDGEWHSVGDVKYIDSLNSTVAEITGSGLWINRNHVVAAAGKFHVTSSGDVRLEDGASFSIQRDGGILEVADAGNIVTKINASTEGVQIKAKKVDLGDYATVGELDAQKARITNLVSGSSTASHLKVKALTVTNGGEFTFKGKIFNSSSIKYVTGVSYTAPSHTYSTYRNFLYRDGDTDRTYYGRMVTGFNAGSISVTTQEKYFLVEDS